MAVLIWKLILGTFFHFGKSLVFSYLSPPILLSLLKSNSVGIYSIQMWFLISLAVISSKLDSPVVGDYQYKKKISEFQGFPGKSGV